MDFAKEALLENLAFGESKPRPAPDTESMERAPYRSRSLNKNESTPPPYLFSSADNPPLAGTGFGVNAAGGGWRSQRAG